LWIFFPIDKYKTIGRPLKYDNNTYLDAMFYVLKCGIGWNYLKGFNLWSSKNIFKLAWAIIVNIYAQFKLDFYDLFIDCSHIKNYLGHDVVGANFYYIFRLSTKLSIITDNMGTPIEIALNNGNVHDIKIVLETIDSIKFDIDYYDAEYLIADKGYVSFELKDTLSKKYYLELITPNKKTKEKRRRNGEENH
jgi:hypothetical protein